MGFRTNGNGPSDQWYFGPMGRRTNGNGNGLSDHRHGTNMSITPVEARGACRTDEMLLEAGKIPLLSTTIHAPCTFYTVFTRCLHRAHFTCQGPSGGGKNVFRFSETNN